MSELPMTLSRVTKRTDLTKVVLMYKRKTFSVVVAILMGLISIYLLRNYIPSFLVGFLFLAVASLVLLTVCRRSFIRDTLFLAAVIFLGLAAAEIYFIVRQATLERNTWEGSYVENFFAKEGDPELGYGIARFDRVDHSIKRASDRSAIYDVNYSIDANGLRKSADTGARVAYFFGCSVTFGIGVNDADTLPVSFARLSGYRTVNFGVPGYGSHHVLRALEIDRPAALGAPRPDMVVYTAILHHINRAAGRGVGWDEYGPSYDDRAIYTGPFKERQRVPTAADNLDLFLRLRWQTYSAILLRLNVIRYEKPTTLAERERFIAMVAKES